MVKVLYDYDPDSGPNEEADELTIREGQILRVYGEQDDDGFFDGEHTDDAVGGLQRGFVPSNFVQVLEGADAVATGVSIAPEDEV